MTQTGAMQVFESSSSEAALNAAFEESVFRRAELSEPLLMLYRNGESVLFGRNQNPWAECEVARCLEQGVALLRRLSGGGTVYQDEGNLNYCFLLPRSNHNPERILTILLRAFEAVGVPNACIRDHSSVCSGERKISGTAFALNGRVAMMHGCILVSADLGRLHTLLSIAPDKTVTGSFVKSNRVPVTSLKALGLQVGCDELGRAVVEAAEREFGSARRVELERDAAVEALAEKFKGAEWTFGRSGDFEISRLTGGGLLRLKVSHGIIVSARLDDCDVAEFVDVPLHEIM